jgi:hypothetical protein
MARLRRLNPAATSLTKKTAFLMETSVGFSRQMRDLHSPRLRRPAMAV